MPDGRVNANTRAVDVDRDMERQLAVARRAVRRIADAGRYWVVLVYELQSYAGSAAPGDTGSQLWPSVAERR